MIYRMYQYDISEEGFCLQAYSHRTILEYRIRYRSDTFINHAVFLLMRSFARQETLLVKLQDIHETRKSMNARVQDDFLKLMEVNRLLSDALEVCTQQFLSHFKIHLVCVK